MYLINADAGQILLNIINSSDCLRNTATKDELILFIQRAGMSQTNQESLIEEYYQKYPSNFSTEAEPEILTPGDELPLDYDND